MTRNYRGSCLCGSISYEVSGFSSQVANCHCSMCRKFHGSAFGTLVSVTGLNWLTGKEHLKDYVGSNGTVRSFCAECGSSIGFRVKDSPLESIELAIATFDEDIPVVVDAQIYTNYKANWVTLHNKITSHGEGRDS